MSELAELGKWVSETCYPRYSPQHCLILQSYLQENFMYLEKLYGGEKIR